MNIATVFVNHRQYQLPKFLQNWTCSCLFNSVYCWDYTLIKSSNTDRVIFQRQKVSSILLGVSNVVIQWRQGCCSSLSPGPSSSEAELVCPICTSTHKHKYTTHMYLYTSSHIHKTDRKHRTHTDSANGLILISFWFTRLKVHLLIYKYTGIQCGCLQHLGSDAQFAQQLPPNPCAGTWTYKPLGPWPHSSCWYRHACTHTQAHTHPQSTPIPYGVAGCPPT